MARNPALLVLAATLALATCGQAAGSGSTDSGPTDVQRDVAGEFGADDLELRPEARGPDTAVDGPGDTDLARADEGLGDTEPADQGAPELPDAPADAAPDFAGPDGFGDTPADGLFDLTGPDGGLPDAPGGDTQADAGLPDTPGELPQTDDGGPETTVPSGPPTYGAPTELGTVASDDVNEASGLAASRRNPGVVWVHNDSGDTARVFAMSTTGRHLGIYYLTGASAFDWEDMASDGTYLYIGDVGDNFRVRAEVVVYRAREPDVTVDQTPRNESLTDITTFRFTYPGGARDCEAIFVDSASGDVFLVTKEASAATPSEVFRAAAPLRSDVATPLQSVAQLTFGGTARPGNPQVTAADLSAAGDALLIRTYNAAFYWVRSAGQSVGEALAGTGYAVPLPGQPQGETLAFMADGLGYLTVSEGGHQPLYGISPVAPDTRARPR